MIDDAAVYVEKHFMNHLADRGLFDKINGPIQYVLNKSEQIMPLDNSASKFDIVPRVMEEEPFVYNFTLNSIFEFSFGFLDGALNTLPQGSLLQQCGVDSKVLREALRKSINFLLLRQLHEAIKEIYTALKQINISVRNCYYGTKYYITVERLAALFAELDLLNNITFNIGYMWTDIVMLLVVEPGKTEADLLYYYAFYVGDFLFRFLFKQTTDGYCWLPWNNCAQVVAAQT